MKYTINLNARKAFIMCVLTFMAAIRLCAQSSVVGVAKDEQSAPLPFANVVLFASADSSFIKGEVSRQDGRFGFQNLPAGSYYCQVSMVGLTAQNSAVFQLDGAPGEFNLGSITLSENTALQEVEIAASKSMIEVRADKVVFNVASTPSVSGTNGMELLSKAPGVTVDMDNNISLLGKSGVQIYINGRPSRLSGNDLAALLQNMNSDNIESVEIISNPSSKYEAEGDAGIINIILKKNVATGLNGNLTSSFQQGRFFRNNNGISLNYGSEKISAFLNVSRSFQDVQDDFRDVKTQNGIELGLISEEVRSRTGYTVSGGVNYLVNERHSFGLSSNAVINESSDRLASTTDIRLEGPLEDQLLRSQTNLDEQSSNYNANFNYRWRISEDAKLSADASVGKFAKLGFTDQPNTFFGPDGSSVLAVSDKAFNTDTEIDMYTALVDYEHEWQRVKLSSGLRYAQIMTDNRFSFFDVIDGAQVPDPLRSNAFTYTEGVAAWYGILDASLGEFWKVNGGMRIEHTNSRGQLFIEVETADADVKRSYTDWFPSAGLSYDDNENHSLSVSVGRRISRPNYQNLNPFESPLSELTAWKGNPFLRPAYTMNYQVVYAFKRKLTMSASYSETNEFVANIFEISGNQSNVIIPRNMANFDRYSLSLTYPLEVTKSWEFVITANGGRSIYQGNLEGTEIAIEADTWNFRIQNNIKLPWDILLDISYYHSSDWIWRGSIDVRGNYDLNFGLRKNFFNERLQVRITGNDILLTTNDYFYQGEYGGIVIDGVRSFDTRRFGAGATWNFGNQKVKNARRSRGALEEELKRLEGSD